MLYEIYNHLALGPTTLVLGDYKSDIGLVGCYNLYICIYIEYIYVYTLNPMECCDGPVGHKNQERLIQ